MAENRGGTPAFSRSIRASAKSVSSPANGRGRAATRCADSWHDRLPFIFSSDCRSARRWCERSSGIQLTPTNAGARLAIASGTRIASRWKPARGIVGRSNALRPPAMPEERSGQRELVERADHESEPRTDAAPGTQACRDDKVLKRPRIAK